MLILDRIKQRRHPFFDAMSSADYKSAYRSEPFVPGTAQLYGRQLHYSDGEGFLHSVREIFYEDVYRFRARNDAPHIIDVGANIGLSLLYFKKLYPHCTIVAYEPDRKIFELLKRNVSGLSGVDLRNSAAWTEDTQLTFYSEGSLAGSVSMDFIRKGDAVTVSAERLKKEIARRPVDFLKIDIEGAENAVLFDIEDELANVDLLFFEYHSVPGEGQRLGELLELVRSAGFRYVINGAHGPRLPFVEVVPHGFDLQLNVSCFRPSRD